MSAAARLHSASPFEQLRQGREIIRAEGQTLLALAENLSEDFCRAVKLIDACRGSVIVSGMGKAGLVGQKLVATFASTGTRSHFLHPGEAIHGDLGRVQRDDIVLILSYSGETEEVIRLLPSFEQLGATIIAVTGQPQSKLGQSAAVTLDLGSIREACPLGLAPSASTTAMLALGDALALVVSQMRQFGAEDFARFHPGGSLGRKLAKVDDVMRPLAECRVAVETESLRSTLVRQSRPGRRSGAIMVVAADGRLSGIFTDSDLARLLEKNREHAIDGPLAEIMTRSPQCARAGSLLSEACELLAERKISELPVVDASGIPLGMIDITDIVGIHGSDGSLQTTISGPALLKLVTPPKEFKVQGSKFKVQSPGERV